MAFGRKKLSHLCFRRYIIDFVYSLNTNMDDRDNDTYRFVFLICLNIDYWSFQIDLSGLGLDYEYFLKPIYEEVSGESMTSTIVIESTNKD